MRKRFLKLFGGYAPLNIFLIMGALISTVSHSNVFTYITIGLLLPLLDWSETIPGRFSKTEIPSKSIWLILMFILSVEVMVFYL